MAHMPSDLGVFSNIKVMQDFHFSSFSLEPFVGSRFSCNPYTAICIHGQQPKTARRTTPNDIHTPPQVPTGRDDAPITAATLPVTDRRGLHPRGDVEGPQRGATRM